PSRAPAARAPAATAARCTVARCTAVATAAVATTTASASGESAVPRAVPDREGRAAESMPRVRVGAVQHGRVLDVLHRLHGAGSAMSVRPGRMLASACRGGDVAQDAVEIRARVVVTIGDHAGDRARVRDVVERVAIEDDEIGELAALDGPEVGGALEELRGFD